MNKMVLVPADLLQATIRYLMARPYAEVAQIIPQLMQCKEAKEEACPTTTDITTDTPTEGMV